MRSSPPALPAKTIETKPGGENCSPAAPLSRHRTPVHFHFYFFQLLFLRGVCGWSAWLPRALSSTTPLSHHASLSIKQRARLAGGVALSPRSAAQVAVVSPQGGRRRRRPHLPRPRGGGSRGIPRAKRPRNQEPGGQLRQQGDGDGRTESGRRQHEVSWEASGGEGGGRDREGSGGRARVSVPRFAWGLAGSSASETCWPPRPS